MRCSSLRHLLREGELNCSGGECVGKATWQGRGI